jgi:putative phosphotransacetylase
MPKRTRLTVGVSARHVHLSPEHLQVLFGPGYELTVKNPISQPGQFAANEQVDVVGPRSTITMRIIGPCRGASQVEVAFTDARALGLPDVPVRLSGDIAGTPGITLRGPKGEVILKEGVIVAARHIHMTPEQAEEFGVKDRQMVKVRMGQERSLVLENVLVRVSKSAGLELHIDTDEANAAGVKHGDACEIVQEG